MGRGRMGIDEAGQEDVPRQGRGCSAETCPGKGELVDKLNDGAVQRCMHGDLSGIQVESDSRQKGVCFPVDCSVYYSIRLALAEVCRDGGRGWTRAWTQVDCCWDY